MYWNRPANRAPYIVRMRFLPIIGRICLVCLFCVPAGCRHLTAEQFPPDWQLWCCPEELVYTTGQLMPITAVQSPSGDRQPHRAAAVGKRLPVFALEDPESYFWKVFPDDDAMDESFAQQLVFMEFQELRIGTETFPMILYSTSPVTRNTAILNHDYELLMMTSGEPIGIQQRDDAYVLVMAEPIDTALSLITYNLESRSFEPVFSIQAGYSLVNLERLELTLDLPPDAPRSTNLNTGTTLKEEPTSNGTVLMTPAPGTRAYVYGKANKHWLILVAISSGTDANSITSFFQPNVFLAGWVPDDALIYPR
ncbi:MAG: hypothetical protein KDK34_01760 [Leptospiraceae bacterium]|nr:hypothetical protein [Leptospiraceae bacterium]